jgi:hypothetical protein
MTVRGLHKEENMELSIVCTISIRASRCYLVNISFSAQVTYSYILDSNLIGTYLHTFPKSMAYAGTFSSCWATHAWRLPEEMRFGYVQLCFF